MKIGIITLWSSQDNYGQLLQCFALQHYLKLKGHEPFLIRYIPQTISRTILDRVLNVWNLLSPRHLKAYKQFLTDKKKSKLFNVENPRFFDAFRKKYIQFSPSIYYNIEELKNENWDADAFICGSDQIWSYSPIKENIEVFFLQFVPENKISIAYAASFGRAELPTDYTEILPQLLLQFKAVSLREETGVDLCKNANRMDAQLVCDPTMLLNGTDFLSTIVNKDIVQTNTVFCYLLNWETDFPLEEIKEFISKGNLEMNFVGAHGIENKNIFPSMKDLTIESWLEKMSASQYVFTNSFHGTVLSILLKKSFIAFPLKGVSAKMNGRLTTLLTKLGLVDRIYNSSKNIDTILSTPINWVLVEDKIRDFRTNSESFLNEALKK